MSKLHSIFLNNNGPTTHKWIHYFDIYEKHFSKFVGKPILMIEVGIDRGGSINMWKEYFGEQAKIVGIDISENCRIYENKDRNIFVEIGDQSDEKFMLSIIEKYGIPDIILDDGSHKQSDLVNTFNYLYQHLKIDGGVYLAEDLQTAYCDGYYEGGLNKPGTFIEFTKAKIDEINHGTLIAHLGVKGYDVTDFAKTTQSITIYDAIVVFEKRLQGRKIDFKTGNNSNFLL